MRELAWFVFPWVPASAGMTVLSAGMTSGSVTGSGYSRSAMFSAVMPASVNAGVSKAEIWTVWNCLRFLWKAS